MPTHEHFYSTTQNKQLQIYYYNKNKKTFSKKMYRFIKTQNVNVRTQNWTNHGHSDMEVICLILGCHWKHHSPNCLKYVDVTVVLELVLATFDNLFHLAKNVCHHNKSTCNCVLRQMEWNLLDTSFYMLKCIYTNHLKKL